MMRHYVRSHLFMPVTACPVHVQGCHPEGESAHSDSIEHFQSMSGSLKEMAAVVDYISR